MDCLFYDTRFCGRLEPIPPTMAHQLRTRPFGGGGPLLRALTPGNVFCSLFGSEGGNGAAHRKESGSMDNPETQETKGRSGRSSGSGSGSRSGGSGSGSGSRGGRSSGPGSGSSSTGRQGSGSQSGSGSQAGGSRSGGGSGSSRDENENDEDTE